MDAPIIVIPQKDRIEAYPEMASEFLWRILGMDAASCLLTDESELSDFAFSGDFTEGEGIDAFMARHQDYASLQRAWRRWVVGRIEQVYGLKLDGVDESLVSLFYRIECLRGGSMQ